ncbi:MAG: hypothetical protein LKJ45_00865 [Oscillospiraceae bacterium]|jgi:hypothetical protein|nr:hypothetical protein [Oscillospiraceae bacterium]
MSKREVRLLALACTFFGIVLGFLLSPIKSGVSVTCGNNNHLAPSHIDRKKKRGPVPVRSNPKEASSTQGEKNTNS